MATEIYTIGHSNRSLDEFVELLKANGITKVVDVRTVPRSRHNPQFNIETLPAALEEHGISYEHMAGLGGLRHPRKDSVNTGWENQSFRGYADYMQTPEFQRRINELIRQSDHERIAIMCAEAVPWRCHRRLIADALLIRGFQVLDIIGKSRVTPHVLTPWAKVTGERITYPSVD
ncbi:MAG: DUF488 domain-containing protein [Candidatus Aquicultor sp.]